MGTLNGAGKDEKISLIQFERSKKIMKGNYVFVMQATKLIKSVQLKTLTFRFTKRMICSVERKKFTRFRRISRIKLKKQVFLEKATGNQGNH